MAEPDETQATPGVATVPTISVVIPAFNEERIITRCLQALTEQTDLPDEIILVDNGCTDDTIRLATQFPRVRIITEPRQGITYARQAGFDASRGDVIARIDADTIVNPQWIARIRQDFTDPELHGQGGNAAIAELSPGNLFLGSWWYRGFRFWHQRSIGVAPMLYGFNSAVRREAWLSARHLVAMGDEHVSEDVDVTIALLKSGHRLRYSPRMLVKARLFRSIDREKLARYYATDGMTLARHQFGNTRRWPGRSSSDSESPSGTTRNS
ncbi:glycosyltransferase family 2 protein [Leucobacter insecticola]|uniref:Glycosyltransferase family 2 protein n=1 Tax=Leucobacter insecticola TaxID=2714934 RepID=A0A6G8FKV5_9MICO|nr:glycosyltransferase family A protein [Leucobacter insecticola]QIM16984.1 glycosyltransferase family 2 protein [Leucobacter insecticola]